MRRSVSSPRRSWYVVDASVWVSRFIRHDAHHAVSRAWLRASLAAGHRIVAPTLLLPELGGAIARQTGNSERARHIVGLVRLTRGHRWVPVNTQLRDHAARLAIDLRLRGADALYVAAADRLRIPLVTWDNEQLARAASRVVVLTPSATP